MTINETNFIKQIKLRNTKALDFMVDTYSNLVFKVAHSVLNSSFYANYVEECVNDIFFSIWNNIESFDEEKGDFKYWITAISKYKAIDYKRKLYRLNTSEALDEYVMPDEVNVENLLISKENRTEIIESLNILNPQDKEIFIRRYFLYEDVCDIAKSFGVDRNIIDKKLSRGRKQLKAKLMPLKGEVI
ncbi:sigma-70 family RNA polymerase sigma factor [Clostridium sp. 'White wine YQ']|uniref:sigma-70 family RNA polymerase sigma factor n=1 Tax=Clostridium sp. 'White wine YQ' TaxID=3027474 RepID=UPI00236518CB|nr:sigma-70 family RNA polymerase sigma factor [Clostridium sp. 'White wine YQ']MDD7793176.1 sigma-70 family RNA polymerase sigma factor [Clostridium sp. 'White wine YQ']